MGNIWMNVMDGKCERLKRKMWESDGGRAGECLGGQSPRNPFQIGGRWERLRESFFSGFVRKWETTFALFLHVLFWWKCLALHGVQTAKVMCFSNLAWCGRALDEFISFFEVICFWFLANQGYFFHKFKWRKLSKINSTIRRSFWSQIHQNFSLFTKEILIEKNSGHT